MIRNLAANPNPQPGKVAGFLCCLPAGVATSIGGDHGLKQLANGMGEKIGLYGMALALWKT
jgi:hypothetical protein